MLSLALTLLLAAPDPAADALLKGSLRLVGRFSAGHACPVEPRVALTNGHVVDQRPFDESVKPFPYAWSDGTGRSGFLVPLRLERARDLAAVEPLNAGDVFPNPFRVAAQAPKPGDRVLFLAYDWRNRKSGMADLVVEAKVARVVANHVLFYPAGQPGSSGSCVVSESGEVVAINEGAYETDDHEEIGLAVGVWGSLVDMPSSGSDDVSPSLPEVDMTNGVVGEVQGSSNLIGSQAGYLQRPNPAHDLVVQFRKRAVLATVDGLGMLPQAMGIASRHTLTKHPGWVSVTAQRAALPSHVGPVVGLGSKEQVGRVNAGRVVALVQDTEFVRDGAVRQRPRDSVRHCGPVQFAPEANSSVASPVAGGLPFPAFVGSALGDLGPEAFFDRLSIWHLKDCADTPRKAGTE